MNIKSIRIKVIAWIFVGISIFLIHSVLISVVSNFASATSQDQQRGLTEAELNKFSQNNILFYNPGECIKSSKSSTSSGTLSASGDYSEVLKAKNANESVFNVEDYSEWSAMWQDGDKEDMKKLLNNYGDLSYQLGKAIGAPWIAIIVQMKYEDPNSVCGKNNFWGNGCDPSHAYLGGATIQGENLGEGFMQYGETLSDDWYESVRGISDPKEYLETLGPLWVQGDPNGAGYGSIEGMKASIDALQDYIDSSEGQAIVAEFGNYSGSTSSSSSSSGSNQNISGDDIIWIGDSDSATAGEALLEETFPGLENGGYGPTFNTPTSYIQSCKFINSDGCGDQPNDSGLEILKKIIKEGKLRKYLVFALGGNGGWTQEDMDAFTDLVGDDTKVILTTTKYRKGDYTESNEIVKKTAEKYANIYVADIAAKYKDEYMDDSGIEFTAEGAKMFVQTIKEALNEAGGGGCGTGEFVWYGQFVEPWSSVEYTVDGVTSTIGEDGCGPTAFAMLANMLLGKEITPSDTIKVAADTHSIIPFAGSIGSELTKNLAEYYGLQWEKLDNSSTETSMNDITNHLKDGWMVMTAGGGSVPYTSGGHYVGIRGITSSGKWLLADSGHSEDISQQEWNPKDVMTAGMNPDNVYAIKSTSSTPCNKDKDNNICPSDDNDGISAGTVGESDKPIGPIHEDSTNVPCDPRTKDVGIRNDAYHNGKPYSIRLCAVPNIPDSDGNAYGINDGYVHVNSRVSGAFYAMAEEYNKRCDSKLSANEDFRTNETQTEYWYQYGQDPNRVAQPGYSNHQEGLAIDFDNIHSCNDSSVSSGGWVNQEFVNQFGLEDAIQGWGNYTEYWHIQAAGNSSD